MVDLILLLFPYSIGKQGINHPKIQNGGIRSRWSLLVFASNLVGKHGFISYFDYRILLQVKHSFSKGCCVAWVQVEVSKDTAALPLSLFHDLLYSESRKKEWFGGCMSSGRMAYVPSTSVPRFLYNIWYPPGQSGWWDPLVVVSEHGTQGPAPKGFGAPVSGQGNGLAHTLGISVYSCCRQE